MAEKSNELSASNILFGLHSLYYPNSRKRSFEDDFVAVSSLLIKIPTKRFKVFPQLIIEDSNILATESQCSRKRKWLVVEIESLMKMFNTNSSHSGLENLKDASLLLLKLFQDDEIEHQLLITQLGSLKHSQTLELSRIIFSETLNSPVTAIKCILGAKWISGSLADRSLLAAFSLIAKSQPDALASFISDALMCISF